MSATLTTPKTTSGGEIIRELVNATDGAGLHFENNGYVDLGNVTAAKFGTSDFSVEFVLNQTAENVHDNYIYFTNISGKNRAFFRNDLVENQFRITFSNSSSTETSVDIAYDMSADYNKPTHYVLTFDRDGLATLYKNGASVGSVDISAFSAINLGDDTTQTQRFGSGADYGVLGTFYRFRTWNKIVDAKALYERADVDFADQYGTTNAPFTSINLSSGWSTVAAGSSIVDSDSFSTTSSGSGVSYPLTIGKRYRVTWNVSGSAYNSINQYTPSEDLVTISTATSGTVEFTAEKNTLYIRNGAAGTTDIASMSLVQIGCVTDYDLAFANPTQSLTVQDRAGAADGTASSSTLVTQVQPIIQGNMRSLAVTTTSQAAGVPADGKVIADSLGIGSGATFADSQAAIVGGDNVGLALQSTHSGKTSRVRFFDNSGNQDATVGFDNSNSNLFMGTGAAAHLTIDTSGDITLAGKLKLEDASVAGWIQSDGSVRVDIDNDDSSTDRAFVVSRDNASATLFSVNELGEVHSSGAIYLQSSGSSYGELGLDSNKPRLRTYGTSGWLTVFTADNNTGVATFSNGIAFQSATTGSGTGTGYTLDKYEEGTFTLTDASGAGLTIGFGGGKYTRIGNRVFITVHFDMPSNSDGQTFNLTGLPFTVHNDNDSRGLVLNYTDKSGISYALTPKNTSNIFLYTASGGGVTNADASGGGFYINGHYVI